MSLKNWQLNGWLANHETSPQEITDLLSVADRDLQDCTVSGLSADEDTGGHRDAVNLGHRDAVNL